MPFTSPTRSARTSPARPPRARRGFAFTEVLFAVMVLGLGFIMIAAMFPVTIRQTQSTMEEAAAAGIASGAMEFLQQVASEDLFPPTVPPRQSAMSKPADKRDSTDMDLSEPAEVVSLPDVFYSNPSQLKGTDLSKAWGNPPLPAYYTVRGNMIDPRNPRVAWVPLYRRLANSPFAQVFIVVVQSRNRDQYLAERDRSGLFPDRNYSDFDIPANVQGNQKGYSTLEPRRIAVGVQWDDTIGGGKVTIVEPAFRDLAATGAYLIIARDVNDGINAPPLNDKGQSNGRVYQLGNPIDEAAGIWELAPGSQMIRTGSNPSTPVVGDDNDLPYPPTAASETTYAYIIGRGYKNPLNSDEGYGGPAQEIGVYTGFIHVPPAPQPQP